MVYCTFGRTCHRIIHTITVCCLSPCMAQIYRVSIHAHVWVSFTLDAALKVPAFASRWGKLMLSNIYGPMRLIWPGMWRRACIAGTLKVVQARAGSRGWMRGLSCLLFFRKRTRANAPLTIYHPFTDPQTQSRRCPPH
jgi:hypothetical protein